MTWKGKQTILQTYIALGEHNTTSLVTIKNTTRLENAEGANFFQFRKKK